MAPNEARGMTVVTGSAAAAETAPAAWAGTDHKRVAAQLLAAAGGFFLLSGAAALLMRSELAVPGLQIVSTSEYDQAFTLHGSGMVYLVMTPVALALGVYLVPLQVGAPDLAWPRLSLFGLWSIVTGGLVMFAGAATAHGAATAGWTAFLPLSNRTYSPGIGMDMWIVGVTLATLGAIALALTVLATILLLRAPGMSMGRIPIFCWTQVVTCLMVVFGFPALVIAMGMLYADRHLGVTIDPLAYQYVFWFYGHPAVYVMFFPFVGAVAEVVAVFSSQRFFGYGAMVLSLVVFTALSMSVWAHHMFTTGRITNEYFALTSTALLAVAGVEYFDMIATMWRGSIRLATPMLFALAFLVQFLVGGLTGIMLASPPLDYHLNDSYFVIAHFHYTLFAGSLFGLFAGVYYWFPKATGRLLPDRLGKLHFWLMVLGTNLTFLPMFVLGYDGMPRRIADYSASAGWEGLNIVSSIGSGVIALSVLVFGAAVTVALRQPPGAGPDPWRGHTLEWATSSPPPRHNFEQLPAIASYAPLLDARERPG
jgi:cytochrome c oxidase subunit 1